MLEQLPRGRSLTGIKVEHEGYHLLRVSTNAIPKLVREVKPARLDHLEPLLLGRVRRRHEGGYRVESGRKEGRVRRDV